MGTLMLERPTPGTALASGRRREVLFALMRRLEAWLPTVERQLTARRARGEALGPAEAEWHTMLALYERLSRTLAAPG